MKKLKRMAAALCAAVMVGAGMMPASAYHGCWEDNMRAALNVLGESDQAILSQAPGAHQCLGTIMASLDKLDEFKQEKLRLKKERLQSQVESGQRTQEQADAILEQVESRMENCDGSGNGYGYGNDGVCVGGGNGWGACDGTGQGQGRGWGHGGGHHGCRGW